MVAPTTSERRDSTDEAPFTPNSGDGLTNFKHLLMSGFANFALKLACARETFASPNAGERLGDNGRFGHVGDFQK